MPVRGHAHAALARMRHQVDLAPQIILTNSTHGLQQAGLTDKQAVRFGSWTTLASHLDRYPLSTARGMLATRDGPGLSIHGHGAGRRKGPLDLYFISPHP